jgi:hypothetical protein
MTLSNKQSSISFVSGYYYCLCRNVANATYALNAFFGLLKHKDCLAVGKVLHATEHQNYALIPVVRPKQQLSKRY